ncbi:MAG: CPBP family intramembrane metalloprotease [Peptococcaceae bacterium]|nr:CPBP family intramembrane metalloprotease [Peptococcaceae bacterium]
MYRPQLQSKWWLLLLFAALYYFFYSFDFTQLFSADTLEALESSDSVSANAFAGIGAAAILPALIQNFIANGLAEEIFFRGFLCKRLCAHFGSTGGILLQAGLFGIMHNAIYLIAGISIGLGAHLILFFFTATGALLLATLNEKLYNGSLLPSVLLHGLGNFITTMLVAF